MSVRQSTCPPCIKVAPTGRISMKFDTRKFYEFVQNLIKIGQKISGIFTWRPKEVVLLPATQTRHEISFRAKLNIFVLLTVTYSSTTHIKCIVAFPFQQWLGESATILRSTYIVHLVVCFRLGNSPASEYYMPTFRNTLFHLHMRVGMRIPTQL